MKQLSCRAAIAMEAPPSSAQLNIARDVSELIGKSARLLPQLLSLWGTSSSNSDECR